MLTQDSTGGQERGNPFSQSCSLSDVFDFLSLQKTSDMKMNSLIIHRPELVAEVKEIESEMKRYTDFHNCPKWIDSTL